MRRAFATLGVVAAATIMGLTLLTGAALAKGKAPEIKSVKFQGTPAEPADGVPDVVAGHGGDEADDADRDDVEPSRPREDGARDEHRLTGHRDAEVLDKDEQRDCP